MQLQGGRGRATPGCQRCCRAAAPAQIRVHARPHAHMSTRQVYPARAPIYTRPCRDIYPARAATYIQAPPRVAQGKRSKWRRAWPVGLPGLITASARTSTPSSAWAFVCVEAAFEVSSSSPFLLSSLIFLFLFHLLFSFSASICCHCTSSSCCECTVGARKLIALSDRVVELAWNPL